MKIRDLDESYQKELEEIRANDKKVWDAANKRGQSKPSKRKETAAERVEKLQKGS